MTHLTIITSVLNGEPYIGAMLASVPRHHAVEHIAIDAGSTDGSLACLRAAPGVRLIEAPGLSLYAAWNLGIERAEGDAIVFLNADDLLPSGALDAWLDGLSACPEAEILLGCAEAFRQANDEEPVAVVRYAAPSVIGLDLPVLALGAPVINAKAMRRTLFDRFGGFDTRYRFAADREFLLRMMLIGPPPRLAVLGAPVYRYRIHDGSMTFAMSRRRRIEIASEHRRIARNFARRPGIAREARHVLHAWLARETAVQAVTSVMANDLHSASSACLSVATDLAGTITGLWRARRLRRAYVSALAGPS